MSIMHRIRIYHAVLAALAILAYLTGDDDSIHAWLGYAVAAVVVFRLLWALTGNPHVGLMRFYPNFEGLNLSNAFTHPAITKTFMLGIAISLLSVTATGILMDQGKSIGLANAQPSATRNNLAVISVGFAGGDGVLPRIEEITGSEIRCEWRPQSVKSWMDDCKLL